MTINYPVQSGQSIYDIAVQVYGSSEGVTTILQDNPTININSDLQGLILIIRQELDTTLPNLQVAKFFRNKQEIVNNADNPTEHEDAWITEDETAWITEDGNFWQL